jgi:hypothetical protein
MFPLPLPVLATPLNWPLKSPTLLLPFWLPLPVLKMPLPALPKAFSATPPPLPLPMFRFRRLPAHRMALLRAADQGASAPTSQPPGPQCILVSLAARAVRGAVE